MTDKTTRKLSRYLLLGGLSFSVLSCGGLDDEALRLGRKYFEERKLKCGDSWFASKFFLFGRKEIVEIKGLEFILNKDSLNKIDRANGIEWRGSVRLQGEMLRKHFQGYMWVQGRLQRLGEPTGWGIWQSWTDFDAEEVEIKRIKGQWQVAGPERRKRSRVRGMAPLGYQKIAFTCDQVPQ